MVRRAAWVMAATLAGVVLGACAGGPQVGARSFPVTLTTSPPEKHAVAYVIPYDDWLKAGGEAAVSRGDFLQKYEVKSGKTDVTVRLPSVSYIYVAEVDGKRFVSDRFTPGSVTSASVRVE